MKKIITLLIFITIICCSCKYKITSPFDYTDMAGSDNNFYTIDANASEEEIKNALYNNNISFGKKIIKVEGYISTSSKIFDNIKNSMQNERDIILDLSDAAIENNYTYTLENDLFLKTIYFASSQKIIAKFFKGCTYLVNIQLPSLLLSIDNTSFENCTSLKNVEYLGTSPSVLTSTPFTASVKPTDLYLPNVEKDPGDNSWKKFLGADWANIHYGVSMPK